MAKDIDWVAIQAFYDEGHTWREIAKEFGITQTTISRAVKKGKFKTRTMSDSAKLSCKQKPRSHTQETKDKISKSMRAFLEQNPHMVGFVKNHWTKRKSWAEEQLENALIENGVIGFSFNHQNGIYCYDFAWADLKLDVEVDGSTHTDPKVKAKDERRDEWSETHGWTVLRFTGKEVRDDLENILTKIKETIILLEQLKAHSSVGQST